MKVLLLCRSIRHPQEVNINAPQLGDIVQMRRADKAVWGDELKHFTVVTVDLNIPCGDEFKKRLCKDCKDNDILKCEFQKYILPEFDAGSIVDEPRVIKKRRYKAVYYPLKTITDKIDLGLEKTEQDESDILSWAVDNEQPKTIIVDKKVVIK